jgi:hypothetical protein
LENIISSFKALPGLRNATNAINGTHIPLADHPNHKVTLAVGDFFNMKKIHSVVLQGVCDVDKIFWNVCASQPRELHDGSSSRCLAYIGI